MQFSEHTRLSQKMLKYSGVPVVIKEVTNQSFIKNRPLKTTS